MLTLVTIQVVNIPHRLKTDDHAYFGYQGSGLCCLHIFFLYSVTMYSPLHMGFECDPSSVRHLRRERSWTRTSKSKMSWISKEDLLTLLLLFRGASNSIPHVNQGAGFYFVFFKGKLLTATFKQPDNAIQINCGGILSPAATFKRSARTFGRKYLTDYLAHSSFSRILLHASARCWRPTEENFIF